MFLPISNKWVLQSVDRLRHASYKLDQHGRDEKSCQYVSTHGLMKSCDLIEASATAAEATFRQKIRRNVTSDPISVYVSTRRLPEFVRDTIDQLECRFTLVTGDCVLSAGPRDLPVSILNLLLNNRNLVRWFAQNCDYGHPKLEPLPLGLDYHSLSQKNGLRRWGGFQTPVDQEKLLDIVRSSAPDSERRIPLMYCNWLHSAGNKHRAECLNEIPRDTTFYEREHVLREKTWRNNSKFFFTVSPIGAGVDCHRTWEALLLGTVPVVKTSGIDRVFEGLPVLVVKSWSQLTKEYLASERKRFLAEKFDFSRLSLKYWADRIRGCESLPASRLTLREYVRAAKQTK